MELSSVMDAYQSPLQEPSSKAQSSYHNKISAFLEVFSMFWWIIAILFVFVWYMYSFSRNVARVRKMRGGG
jgi:hypothetical protein